MDWDFSNVVFPMVLLGLLMLVILIGIILTDNNAILFVDQNSSSATYGSGINIQIANNCAYSIQAEVGQRLQCGKTCVTYSDFATLPAKQFQRYLSEYNAAYGKNLTLCQS